MRIVYLSETTNLGFVSKLTNRFGEMIARPARAVRNSRSHRVEGIPSASRSSNVAHLSPKIFFLTCDVATSKGLRVRVGRLTSSPSQFGQMADISLVHDSQNVHSYEQMNAMSVWPIGEPHFSHFNFIFGMILKPACWRECVWCAER